MSIFWIYAKTRLVGNIIKKCPTSISLLVFFGCICIYVPYLYLYLYWQRVGRCALESSSGASRKCTHAVSPRLTTELAATLATCATCAISILCEIFLQYTCKYAVICDLNIWRSCWRFDLEYHIVNSVKRAQYFTQQKKNVQWRTESEPYWNHTKPSLGRRANSFLQRWVRRKDAEV